MSRRGPRRSERRNSPSGSGSESDETETRVARPELVLPEEGVRRVTNTLERDRDRSRTKGKGPRLSATTTETSTRSASKEGTCGSMGPERPSVASRWNRWTRVGWSADRRDSRQDSPLVPVGFLGANSYGPDPFVTTRTSPRRPRGQERSHRLYDGSRGVDPGQQTPETSSTRPRRRTAGDNVRSGHDPETKTGGWKKGTGHP